MVCSVALYCWLLICFRCFPRNVCWCILVIFLSFCVVDSLCGRTPMDTSWERNIWITLRDNWLAMHCCLLLIVANQIYVVMPKEVHVELAPVISAYTLPVLVIVGLAIAGIVKLSISFYRSLEIERQKQFFKRNGFKNCCLLLHLCLKVLYLYADF